MNVVTVNSFSEWRQAARKLLAQSISPADARFTEQSSQQQLFMSSPLSSTLADARDVKSRDDAKLSVASAVNVARVPRRFIELAQKVACHRDPRRFDLLYRVLWRISHDERKLLDVETDDDVHQLMLMEKAVRRDAHKMKAFVRFRRIVAEDQEQFIAWHRPDHRIVRLVAPFFARRFPTMKWSILTPDESVVWDQKELLFGSGVPASAAPRGDELEELWRTYYASIFNPARIKVKAMKREMPVRHWPTLPETELIPGLLAESRNRVAEMIQRGVHRQRSAADVLPPEHTIESLREYAGRCQGCELYCDATQTVFGEGPTPARIMLVGEQPGDMEDVAGRPFVGPAGKVLDDAMRQAGLNRSEAYMTNAVKHFKFILRGKKRIHNKPSIQEAIACRPWLVSELELVRPQVLVCLGATAAQSLMGTDFRITRDRGKFISTNWCDTTIATFHPSAVLRAPDETRRREIWAALLSDLQRAAEQSASLESNVNTSN
jgi:probable DNA metabolism protein